MTFTFTAFNPFFPSVKSNSTASPSLISSIKPEICTKCSLSFPSSVIKPNPFESLKKERRLSSDPR